MVLPPWNMLVVDDDKLLCQTAIKALNSIGIKAEWTLSGEKAVELVIQHHQKKDDYQIILLDWKLPDMNGIQVAREIRRNLENEIPILLISAYDWSEFETCLLYTSFQMYNNHAISVKKRLSSIR